MFPDFVHKKMNGDRDVRTYVTPPHCAAPEHQVDQKNA